MPQRPTDPVSQLSPRRNFSAVATLTVSFLLMGGLGSAGIYCASKVVPGCNVRMALGRAAIFTGMMLLVHVAGYRLWRRQFSPLRSEDRGWGLSAYRRPVKIALLQQGICLILALLVLDGGITLNATVIALIAYWIAVFLIVSRRVHTPTRNDLFFVRYGFLLIWGFVVIAGPMVWYRLQNSGA